MTPATSVLSMIGNTPMLELTRTDTGPCRLFVKLENQNPGGSIKDRIALSMVEAAERDGRLKPGGTIVEATAGNTGLGLALVAAEKGYRLVLVIPDKMSADKIRHLRALGVPRCGMTRSDVAQRPSRVLPGHGRTARRRTRPARSGPASSTIRRTRSRPSRPRPDRRSGSSSDDKVDAIRLPASAPAARSPVLGSYFASIDPDLTIVVADPEGSVVGTAVETGEVTDEGGSWLVEGIGEDFIPPNLRLVGDRRLRWCVSRCRGADRRRRRSAADRGHPRRQFDRHAPRRRPQVVSAQADRAQEARRDLRLRYRQQVPRPRPIDQAWLVDSGWLDRPTARRPARPDHVRRADQGRVSSASDPDDTILNTAIQPNAGRRGQRRSR
ncbi:MAG: PLP-dependent cysteine synthase family protein [Thalassobaculum sp.]